MSVNFKEIQIDIDQLRRRAVMVNNENLNKQSLLDFIYEVRPYAIIGIIDRLRAAEAEMTNQALIAAGESRRALNAESERDCLIEALEGVIKVWDLLFPGMENKKYSQDQIEDAEWTEFRAARAAIKKARGEK